MGKENIRYKLFLRSNSTTCLQACIPNGILKYWSTCTPQTVEIYSLPSYSLAPIFQFDMRMRTERGHVKKNVVRLPGRHEWRLEKRKCFILTKLFIISHDSLTLESSYQVRLRRDETKNENMNQEFFLHHQDNQEWVLEGIWHNVILDLILIMNSRKWRRARI